MCGVCGAENKASYTSCGVCKKPPGYVAPVKVPNPEPAPEPLPKFEDELVAATPSVETGPVVVEPEPVVEPAVAKKPAEPTMQEFLEGAGLARYLPLFEERQLSYLGIKWSEEGQFLFRPLTDIVFTSGLARRPC